MMLRPSLDCCSKFCSQYWSFLESIKWKLLLSAEGPNCHQLGFRLNRRNNNGRHNAHYSFSQNWTDRHSSFHRTLSGIGNSGNHSGSASSHRSGECIRPALTVCDPGNNILFVSNHNYSASDYLSLADTLRRNYGHDALASGKCRTSSGIRLEQKSGLPIREPNSKLPRYVRILSEVSSREKN
jgi:hypothetical protein